MLLKINKNPSRKELRQFGLTFIIGFGVIGALLLWRGKASAAHGVWWISSSAGVLALLIPQAGRILYLAWMGLAFIMGNVMTRIVLTILFFGVMTPVAVLFRCMGRDVLRLKKNSATGSYWIDHHKITDRTYYQRLF